MQKYHLSMKTVYDPVNHIDSWGMMPKIQNPCAAKKVMKKKKAMKKAWGGGNTICAAKKN